MLPAGDQSLGAVIVGSAYRDDLNALTGTLTAYKTDIVLWGIDPEANQTTAALYTTLLEQGASVQALMVGQSLDLGDGAHLDMLWVGERGAVLWLEWQNFSALLPTGKVDSSWLEVPKTPDAVLLPDGLAAEDQALTSIKHWSPAVILLPLAESDLPLQRQPEMLSALEGYPVVCTYEHGWVRLTTDGEMLWVTGDH